MTAIATTDSERAKKQLPIGWRWAQIGTICEINPSRPSLNRSDDELTTFVPMSAVDAFSHSIVESNLRPFGEIKRGYTYFGEGDVLFAKITPCMQNGKHAIARRLTQGVGFGTTEFHVLRPNPELRSDWLHSYLVQPWVLRSAAAHFAGSVGQQRVPERFIANLEIPLPPLSVQDSLIGQLSRHIANVYRARAAAEAQLEAAERFSRATIEEAFRNRAARKWPLVKMKELSRISSGGTPSRGNPNYFSGVIPWVKTLDLNLGRVTKTEECISNEAFDAIRGELLPVGTIMAAMYGGSGTIGKSGILGVEACTNQAVCSILPNPELYVPEFLHYWLVYFRPSWMEFSGGNRRDPNINKSTVANARIPLPTIAEQRTAVTRLNAQLHQCRALVAGIRDQFDSIGELPSSLLEGAFKGEM